MSNRNTIKDKFVTGAIPTQQDFHDFIDYAGDNGGSSGIRGQMARIIYEDVTTKRANFNLINKTFTLYPGTWIYSTEDIYIISEETSVDLVGWSNIVSLNVDTLELTQRNGMYPHHVGEREIVLFYLMFETAARDAIDSISCDFEYYINGLHPDSSSSILDKKNMIRNDVFMVTPLSPEEFIIPEKFPSQALGSVEGNFQQKPLSELYSDYDELIAEYPEFMSKSVLATDPWGFDILRIDVKAPEISGSNNKHIVPKIFWNVGIHGMERENTNIAFKTLKYMLDNFYDNPVIHNYLQNHHLIIIPVCNPSGYTDGTRKNRNGIDLNRNMPDGWIYIDEANPSHGGTEPLSEIESQCIYDILHNEVNLKIFFDLHTFGAMGGDPSPIVTWLPVTSYAIGDIFKSFIRSFSMQLRSIYPELPEKTDFGYTDYTILGGTTDEEAIACGIWGACIETRRSIPLLGNIIDDAPAVTSGVTVFLNVNLLMSKNIAHIDPHLIRE